MRTTLFLAVVFVAAVVGASAHLDLQEQEAYPPVVLGAGSGSGSGSTGKPSLEVAAGGDVKITTGPEAAAGSGSGN